MHYVVLVLFDVWNDLHSVTSIFDIPFVGIFVVDEGEFIELLRDCCEVTFVDIDRTLPGSSLADALIPNRTSS